MRHIRGINSTCPRMLYLGHAIKEKHSQTWVLTAFLNNQSRRSMNNTRFYSSKLVSLLTILQTQPKNYVGHHIIWGYSLYSIGRYRLNFLRRKNFETVALYHHYIQPSYIYKTVFNTKKTCITKRTHRYKFGQTRRSTSWFLPRLIAKCVILTLRALILNYFWR